MARSLRQSLDELGEDHVISTSRGERVFAEGDRIYFFKNDRELGVRNGTLGTIAEIADGKLGKELTVRLDKEDGGKPITIEFSLERYNELDHGYAATIHKGQGVTVDNTYVLASEYLDRHAIYVAMTRHRDMAELYWSKESFSQYDNMVEALSRQRAKDSTLDYALEKQFAQLRGVELTEGWGGYESYPTPIIENTDGFIVPKGYEDIFTSELVNKINESNLNDFSDLFNGKRSNAQKMDLEKFDDKEIDL